MHEGQSGLWNYEVVHPAMCMCIVCVITTPVCSTRTFWLEYTKLTWGTANPQLKLLRLEATNTTTSISDIRKLLACPACEAILKVCVIFRTATGSLKQWSPDNSDLYIPVYASDNIQCAWIWRSIRGLDIFPWLEPIILAAVETQYHRCCICQFKSYCWN